VRVARGTPSKWLKSTGSTLYKLVREFANRAEPVHYIIGAHGLKTCEHSHVLVSNDVIKGSSYNHCAISLTELCNTYLPRLIDKTPGRVRSVFLDICYSGLQQSCGPVVFPVATHSDVWWWIGHGGVPHGGHADAPIARQSACMRWCAWVDYCNTMQLSAGHGAQTTDAPLSDGEAGKSLGGSSANQ
jgi:hypothetical protein